MLLFVLCARCLVVFVYGMVSISVTAMVVVAAIASVAPLLGGVHDLDKCVSFLPFRVTPWRSLRQTSRRKWARKRVGKSKRKKMCFASTAQGVIAVSFGLTGKRTTRSQCKRGSKYCRRGCRYLESLRDLLRDLDFQVAWVSASGCAPPGPRRRRRCS